MTNAFALNELNWMLHLTCISQIMVLHYYIQILSKFKSTCSLIDVIRGKKFSTLSVFERAAL